MGIDIGRSATKIGLVDMNYKLLAHKVIRTEPEKHPEEIIRNIGEAVLGLMEEHGIAVDQCAGAGVGVPGTVDDKKGVVIESDYIPWKHVQLENMLEEYLPVPVKVADDADFAALGAACLV
ncbi:MAG: ROK family protein [Eubacteriales bacterium]|nr:ROK family protein [Eubacteriales bacterium]